jgi:hypothetical protein
MGKDASAITEKNIDSFTSGVTLLVTALFLLQRLIVYRSPPKLQPQK